MKPYLKREWSTIDFMMVANEKAQLIIQEIFIAATSDEKFRAFDIETGYLCDSLEGTNFCPPKLEARFKTQVRDCLTKK